MTHGRDEATETTEAPSPAADDAGDGRTAHPPVRDETSPGPVSWEVMAQVVGVVGAVSAWVVAVGMTRAWARLEAAGVPSLPTLAAVDQQSFVVDGLQIMALPLVLGAVSALLCFKLASGAPFVRAEVARRGSELPRAEDPVGAPVADPAPPPAAVPGGDGVADTDAGADSAADPTALPARTRSATSHTFVIGAPRKTEGRSRSEGGTATAGATAGATGAEATEADAGAADIAEVEEAKTAHPQAEERAKAAAEQRGSRSVWFVVLPAVMVLVVLVIADASLLWLWVAVVASVASVLMSAVYVARGSDTPIWIVPIVVLLVFALASVVVALVVAVRLPWLAVMAVVTLLAWLPLWGDLERRSPGRVALLFFVVVVAWSGALAFSQEAGDRTPDLTPATVLTISGEQVEGYLLDRSGAVLLAQPLAAAPTRSVRVVEADDVAAVAYGTDRALPVEESPPGDDDAFDLLSTIDGWLGGTLPDVREPSTEAPRAPGLDGNARDEEDTGDRSAPIVSPEPGTGTDTTVPSLDRRAFGERRASIDGIETRVRVVVLERRGTYVHLEADVQNLDEDELVLASPFADGGDGPTVTALFDPEAGRLFSPATVDGRCVCDPSGPTTLAPDAQRRLSATFEVPDRDVADLDVFLPWVGWVTGVPVE